MPWSYCLPAGYLIVKLKVSQEPIRIYHTVDAVFFLSYFGNYLHLLRCMSMIKKKKKTNYTVAVLVFSMIAGRVKDTKRSGERSNFLLRSSRNLPGVQFVTKAFTLLLSSPATGSK